LTSRLPDRCCGIAVFGACRLARMKVFDPYLPGRRN
jgi:hypothetical protein